MGEAAHSQKRGKDIHQAVLVSFVLGHAALENDNALQKGVHILEEDDDNVIVSRDLAAGREHEGDGGADGGGRGKGGRGGANELLGARLNKVHVGSKKTTQLVDFLLVVAELVKVVHLVDAGRDHGVDVCILGLQGEAHDALVFLERIAPEVRNVAIVILDIVGDLGLAAHGADAAYCLGGCGLFGCE